LLGFVDIGGIALKNHSFRIIVQSISSQFSPKIAQPATNCNTISLVQLRISTCINNLLTFKIYINKIFAEKGI
jgi:hypothetical protein